MDPDNFDKIGSDWKLFRNFIQESFKQSSNPVHGLLAASTGPPLYLLATTVAGWPAFFDKEYSKEDWMKELRKYKNRERPKTSFSSPDDDLKERLDQE